MKVIVSAEIARNLKRRNILKDLGENISENDDNKDPYKVRKSFDERVVDEVNDVPKEVYN